MLERLTVWCGEQSWLNNPSINVGHTQPLMAKALLGSNVFSKMARPLRRFLAGGDRCCRGFGFSIICQCTWMPNWVLHKSLDHHHPKNPSNSNIIQYPQGCPFPRHECLPLHLVKGALESRAIMWDLLGFPHDHLSSTCSSESAVGHCHDTWLGPKSDEEWRNISAFVDLKFGSASLANRKIKYIYIYSIIHIRILDTSWTSFNISAVHHMKSSLNTSETNHHKRSPQRVTAQLRCCSTRPSAGPRVLSQPFWATSDKLC